MPEQWNDYGFAVGMPHMVPEKLSEVELLKQFGDFQWATIAGHAGRPSSAIVNESGDRLYASFIDVELGLADRALEQFGEGSRVFAANRARFFARKFVEGFFVFDDAPVEPGVLTGLDTRDDLRACGKPWAYMTNAFIARFGANDKLKVFEPEGLGAREVPELDERPEGIADHARVLSTGRIPGLDAEEGWLPVRPQDEGRVRYRVTPESDLNGAGLLYFARFVAIMNYGERVFLSDHLAMPVSYPLLQCLSTEHRRVFYFANAAPSDTVEVSVTVRLAPDPEATALAPRYRTPFRLLVRTDLHRRSDRVLMASSLARKALHVPAHRKGVLAEAERLSRRIREEA